MLLKIHNWWMKLDPSEQYMYWIITFAGMLFSSVLLFILASELNFISMSVFPFIGFGILGFLTLFIAVIIYLNLIWPKIYKKEQKKYKNID